MRTIKYGSICSGIEAATVAWSPLGWKPAWFAEIDAFPCELLSYRYPGVTNHGDFTRIGADAGPIDLLVGGTPCQAFSVAGLRGGMDDERGKLTLEFLKLAGRLRPRWLAWENVPGVLSIDGGRTLIPRKNGKLAADSPRYKAIGNSWAVPVARWIGQRIHAVEDIINA